MEEWRREVGKECVGAECGDEDRLHETETEGEAEGEGEDGGEGEPEGA